MVPVLPMSTAAEIVEQRKRWVFCTLFINRSLELSDAYLIEVLNISVSYILQ